VVVALYATVQLACGSGAAPVCGAGGSPPDCDRIVCAVSASEFPSFDKTCATPADCVIGVHQFNCCGSTIALGMNRVEQDRFAGAEQTCAEQYPRCACAQTATAEDGRSTFGGTVVVACQSSQCMTAVQ
jgi:hypothetical protein